MKIIMQRNTFTKSEVQSTTQKLTGFNYCVISAWA